MKNAFQMCSVDEARKCKIFSTVVMPLFAPNIDHPFGVVELCSMEKVSFFETLKIRVELWVNFFVSGEGGEDFLCFLVYYVFPRNTCIYFAQRPSTRFFSTPKLLKNSCPIPISPPTPRKNDKTFTQDLPFEPILVEMKYALDENGLGTADLVKVAVRSCHLQFVQFPKFCLTNCENSDQLFFRFF